MACRDAAHVSGVFMIAGAFPVMAAGGTIEVFDYPGSGHLFTDPTTPAEYDPAATETFWSRALPFLLACG